jgi:hypothetical protein
MRKRRENFQHLMQLNSEERRDMIFLFLMGIVKELMLLTGTEGHEEIEAILDSVEKERARQKERAEQEECEEHYEQKWMEMQSNQTIMWFFGVLVLWVVSKLILEPQSAGVLG